VTTSKTRSAPTARERHPRLVAGGVPVAEKPGRRRRAAAGLGDVGTADPAKAGQLLGGQVDHHHLAREDVGGELGAIALAQAVLGQELTANHTRGACREGLGTVIEHELLLLG
jgi:hypothetical protein